MSAFGPGSVHGGSSQLLQASTSSGRRSSRPVHEPSGGRTFPRKRRRASGCRSERQARATDRLHEHRATESGSAAANGPPTRTSSSSAGSRSGLPRRQRRKRQCAHDARSETNWPGRGRQFADTPAGPSADERDAVWPAVPVQEGERRRALAGGQQCTVNGPPRDGGELLSALDGKLTRQGTRRGAREPVFLLQDQHGLLAAACQRLRLGPLHPA